MTAKKCKHEDTSIPLDPVAGGAASADVMCELHLGA